MIPKVIHDSQESHATDENVHDLSGSPRESITSHPGDHNDDRIPKSARRSPGPIAGRAEVRGNACHPVIHPVRDPWHLRWCSWQQKVHCPAALTLVTAALYAATDGDFAERFPTIFALLSPKALSENPVIIDHP